LVLQLKRIEVKGGGGGGNQMAMKGGDGQVEWGEFLHRKGEKFFDFSKIRREIEEQTVRIAGFDKNIAEEPISLTIYSPFVVDLTMVDLPGITKVPIKG
jgi:dynamin 1-like protein